MDELTKAASSQEDESISVAAPTRRICVVCHYQTSQYTCPRCNIPYCSMKCYKDHSDRCTQAFQKDNVAQAIKANKVSDFDKDAILKKIHEFEEENPHADPIPDELAEQREEYLLRLSEQDGELALHQLPKDMQLEFKRKIADGSLAKELRLDDWQPWWGGGAEGAESDKPQPQQPLVAPLHLEKAEEEHEGTSVGPARSSPPSAVLQQLDPLPKLHTLLPPGKEPAHDTLQWNVIDLLLSYAAVQRLYVGEWQSDTVAAGSTLMSVSAVLTDNARHPSASVAVASFLQRCTQVVTPRNIGFGFTVLEDVVTILRDHHTVQLALADAHAVLNDGSAPPAAPSPSTPLTSISAASASASASAEPSAPVVSQSPSDDARRHGKGRRKGDGGGRRKTRTNRTTFKSKRALASRKLFFFLVWSSEHLVEDVLSRLCVDVEAELHVHSLQQQLSRTRVDNQAQSASPSTPVGRPLITEL